MTPLEINIAICKATGIELYWIRTKPPVGSESGTLQYSGPDFYNDLNAIQGAVAQLGIGGQERFGFHLAVIIGLGDFSHADYDREKYMDLSFFNVAQAVLTTPAQWCEAYLRSLNLFTND